MGLLCVLASWKEFIYNSCPAVGTSQICLLLLLLKMSLE